MNAFSYFHISLAAMAHIYKALFYVRGLFSAAQD